MLFKGSAPAIITPFHNFSIDFDALGRVMDLHLNEKSDALVVCGTTGEASTLSDDERIEVVKFVCARVGGKLPVIAGTGSNETAHTIALSRRAQEAGADALLVVTPYYNKTSQAGLVAHYEAIADAVDIPIVMYNVPSRTGMNMSPAVVERLSRHRNIVATKEASGDMGQVLEITRLCGPDFAVYSGSDETTLSMLALGCHGVITTVGNVVPREMHALCQAWFDGRPDEALRLQQAVKPLIDAVFSEVNPIPIKYAASLCGLCDNELRLPLVPIGQDNARRVDEAMAPFRAEARP